MAENTENQTTKEPSFDPRIQTENLAFDPGEMVGCGRCGRMNAPNRATCIYCAAELEISDGRLAAIKANLRRLELWERGINVVLAGRDALRSPDAAKLAGRLSMETDHLTAILDHDAPLPLARVGSETDAVVVQKDLEALGLRCLLISDLDLAPEKLPVRLGRIDLANGQIALRSFNTGEPVITRPGDLALIVPGIIVSSRVDALEKKRRHGKTKLIGETTTSADEPVLDIYTIGDPVGFRVLLAGFDFSCLGQDKTLLAVENLKSLIGWLGQNAPHAKLVDDYASIRHALGAVWEIETRNDPQGLQRSGFGKRDFASVATTSNLNQFTKYSRLQWRLL